MSLDARFLFCFLLVFVRCSSMLFASPVLTAGVPIVIRVLISGMLSAALAPVAYPLIGPPPGGLDELGSAVLYEALVGLLIGFCLQALTLAAEAAGSFLDIQIGLGSAQLLNPLTGRNSSIVAHFKYMLALLVLLLMNGHHIMLQAFVASYELGHHGALNPDNLQVGVLQLVGMLSVLSLQMAAPVAAVCFVVDAAASLVNKAVPQMQAFLVSMPAKLAAGLLVLAVALPLMTVAMSRGVENTFALVFRILGRG